MNKILSIVLAIFVFTMIAGNAMAVVEGPFTVISGQVTDESGPVNGATVKVTCDSNTASDVLTDANGMYYVNFAKALCTVGGTVSVEVQKDGAQGSNTGSVNYDGSCKINTSIVNVSIPEFGILAGAIALVGALGIFVYRRHN